MFKHFFLKLIIFITYCQTYAQADSVEIYRAIIEGDHWYGDNITFNDKEAVYSKWHSSQKIAIPIYKYKIFTQFLRDNIDEEKIKKLAKLDQQDLLINSDLAHFEYTFYFFKKGNMKTYTIRISDCIKYCEEYKIIQKIDSFIKQFYKEHGCDKPYFVHEVKQDETFLSIAKKYGLNSFMLMIFNNNNDINITHINKRPVNLWAIHEQTESLVVGDKLLIPCFPHE